MASPALPTRRSRCSPTAAPLVTGGTTSPTVTSSERDPGRRDLNPSTETWSTMASQAKGVATTDRGAAAGRSRARRRGRPAPRLSGDEPDQRADLLPAVPLQGPPPGDLSAPATVQSRPPSPSALESAGVSEVSLVRLGAETHAFDQNQRFVPLPSAAERQLRSTPREHQHRAARLLHALRRRSSGRARRSSTMVRLPAANEDQRAPGAPGSCQRRRRPRQRPELSLERRHRRRSIRAITSTAARLAGFTPTAGQPDRPADRAQVRGTGLAAGKYYYAVQAEDQARQPRRRRRPVQVDVDRRHHRADRRGQLRRRPAPTCRPLGRL